MYQKLRIDIFISNIQTICLIHELPSYTNTMKRQNYTFPHFHQMNDRFRMFLRCKIKTNHFNPYRQILSESHQINIIDESSNSQIISVDSQAVCMEITDSDSIQNLFDYEIDRGQDKEGRFSTDEPPNIKKRKKSQKPRKIRSTITNAKLQQMNKLFVQYFIENRDKYEQKVTATLRQISRQLGLGCSTILQKYRQFRINKKVKGGTLLSSKQVKRKYKKSLIIQSYILKALNSCSLHSAKEVSHYIFEHERQLFSKTKIARHLFALGFSFNYYKPVVLERNTPAMIQNRRIYSQIIDQQPKDLTVFVYVDQLALSKNIFKRRMVNAHNSIEEMLLKDTVEDYVSVVVAASNQRVIYYQIKDGFFSRQNFCEALRLINREVEQDLFDVYLPFLKQPILLTDMNRIHYDLSDQPSEKKIIENTLNELKCQRFFLPSNSPQLNPLQSFFDMLAGRIRQYEIPDRNSLRIILEKEMRISAEEPMCAYFKDIDQWMGKARQSEPF